MGDGGRLATGLPPGVLLVRLLALEILLPAGVGHLVTLTLAT